jgi:hypothetical protein
MKMNVGKGFLPLPFMGEARKKKVRRSTDGKYPIVAGEQAEN